MRGRRLPFVVSVFLSAGLVAVHAAELQERTRVAYEEYATRARQAFLVEASTDGTGRPVGAVEDTRVRTGAVVAGPGGEDGIIGVPGGLVHHWTGAMFVPDATLDEVLGVSRAYERYPAMYESIVSVRVLEQQADDAFQLLIRLAEQASVVTAVLDVWSDVRYVRVNGVRAYSLTTSREIREVKNAGQSGEQRLPPGQDRGFLWRANTFAMYTAADGGVYVRLETIGLSRSFPPMLGWVIEPIARRLGRKSVEASLQEFRKGLVSTNLQ